MTNKVAQVDEAAELAERIWIDSDDAEYHVMPRDNESVPYVRDTRARVGTAPPQSVEELARDVVQSIEKISERPLRESDGKRERIVATIIEALQHHAGTAPEVSGADEELTLETVLWAAANFISCAPDQRPPEQREVVLKGLGWAIEQLADAYRDPEVSGASPRPWRVDHTIETEPLSGRMPQHHWHIFSDAPGPDFIVGEATKEANAQLIVAAVNSYRAGDRGKHKPDCEAYCRGEESCDCGAFVRDENEARFDLGLLPYEIAEQLPTLGGKFGELALMCKSHIATFIEKLIESKLDAAGDRGSAEQMRTAMLDRLWDIQSSRSVDETPEETIKVDRVLSELAAELEKVPLPAPPADSEERGK